MSDNQDSKIEELQQDIVDLKIRLKRVEELLMSFPTPSEFIEEEGLDVVDPIYNEVAEMVMQYDTASASFIQRKFSIGYARAARLLDILEEKGIVGPAEGSTPREVLKRA